MSVKTKILVVDDEEVVRRSHMRVLKSEGCSVKAVLNGIEALEAMEAEPCDVVLLDLRMPGMDGLAVLKAIKARWPGSQVIIVTGYPSLDTAKEAIRYGAYDYLAKPVEPEEIVRVAHGALVQKGWSLLQEQVDTGAAAVLPH
jgi:DNA-binding NtrC family response regulator